MLLSGVIAILVAYGAIIYVITVLIGITLTILCLDSKSTERMIVAGINFICHLLCIQEIHWLLPFNGANAPNILFFYRDSLILSGLSIFLTVFLRQLQVISMPAPGWLSTSIAFMIKSRARQIFLLNTLNPKASQKVKADARNSDLMRVVDEDTTWVYFAVFLGWLSFIGVFVTYIVMLLSLVPNS